MYCGLVLLGQSEFPDSTLKAPIPSAKDSIQPLEIDTAPKEVKPEFIGFLKKEVTKSPDSLNFNLLIIKNIYDEVKSGTVELILPKGWEASGFEGIKPIKLEPGEQKIFPFFVRIGGDVVGGSTYLVTAKFIDSKTGVAEVNYHGVTIPKKSKWTMVVPNRLIYFDVKSRYAEAKIVLKNQGNTVENIYLKLSMEQNIRVRNLDYPEDELYLSLPPNSDTTISVEVAYNPPLNPLVQSVQSRYGNNLKIKAQNGKEVVSSIYFAKLPSNFENPISKTVYPLQTSIYAQNLLSDGNTLYQFIGDGTLLFCNDRTLDYRLNIQRLNAYNIPLGLTYAEQLYQYSFVRVNYNTPHYRVSLGDVSNGFDLISFGRGIEAEYKHKTTSVIGNATFNTRFPIATYAGMFKTRLKGISLAGGATYQNDNFNRINSTNYGGEIGFGFLKHHSFTAKVALSERENFYQLGDFNGQEVFANQRLTGNVARLGYTFNIKGFNLNLSAMQSSPNHSGSVSNTNQYDANLGLNVSKNARLTVSGSIMENNPRIFFQGRIIPVQEFNQRYVNALYNHRFRNRLIFSAGGNFTNAVVFSSYTGLANPYPNETNNYNAQLKMGYTLANNSSISLFAIRGFYQIVDFYPGAVSSFGDFDPTQLYPNTRFTANYRVNQSGISISFINGIFGPTQLQLLPAFGKNQTIQITPYINKLYLNDKLLLRSYNTILFQTATKSESFNVNLSPRLMLDEGWIFDLNATYRVLSRENAESQRFTTRNFFVSAGVTKRFNFQQPCIKYYDLTVVYFKDLNGNGLKEENEPFIENVISRIRKKEEKGDVALNGQNLAMVEEDDVAINFIDSNKDGKRYESEPVLREVTQEKTKKTRPGQFVELEMISSKKGMIEYKNIPEGTYVLNSFPLKRLIDVYNVNGPEQEVEIFGNTTIYIPFSESYRISGRVIVEKQEFSTLKGEVDVSSIAIVAKDVDGNTYKTLTDKNGYFSIGVPPKKGIYEVKINNIFGPPLLLEQNNFKVEFSGFKAFEINFIYKEKERGINGHDGYAFKALTGKDKPVENQTQEPSKGVEPPKKETPSATTAKPKEVVIPTIDDAAEEKLWDKANDLQRQIDELRKLKQEIENIQTSQQKTLEELKKAKAQLDSAQKQIDNSITNLPASTDNGKLGDQIIPNNMEQYDELDNLIDQLIEKTNPRINYRVEFGVFTEKMPISFLNQLIKFGNIETSQNDDGSSTFKSKPFDTEAEAQEYADYLQKTGMSKISVIGEINGKKASLNEVKELQNK